MSENGRDERNEAILARNGATRRSFQNRVISPITGEGTTKDAREGLVWSTNFYLLCMYLLSLRQESVKGSTMLDRSERKRRVE